MSPRRSGKRSCSGAGNVGGSICVSDLRDRANGGFEQWVKNCGEGEQLGCSTTSGTRIRVRLFGSFVVPNELHEKSDAIAVGSRDGVPMGGDLISAPAGEAPRFLVWALGTPQAPRSRKFKS